MGGAPGRGGRGAEGGGAKAMGARDGHMIYNITEYQGMMDVFNCTK